MGYLVGIIFFFEKLYKDKFFLGLLLIIFIFSLLAWLYVSSVFIPFYFAEATNLDEEPENYFSYEELEKYSIEQIFGSDDYIITSSEAYSEISEIQNRFETKNVEYLNEYYELHLSVGRFDPSPLCIFGVVFSGIFLGGIVIVKIISNLIKE